MPAETMLIWKTSDEPDPGVYTVQQPGGGIHAGLTLTEVRHMAIDNRWAVEYPTTPAPASAPPAP
jgi:hypothetical protein